MLTPLLPLWIVTMCCQFLIAIRIYRSPSIRTAFKAYICFETIAAPALFVVFVAWPQAYQSIYISSTVITGLLTLMIAADVYRCVFGPRKALPPKVPETTAQLVTMAISGAVALAVFLPATSSGLARSLFLVEQIFSAVAWAVLLILLIYSLSLKIAWPRDIAGLALGFVLYLTIDVLSVFARARGNAGLQLAAGVASRIAYLLALGWWTVFFWKREPAPTEVTREQVATMKMYHAESLKGLVRSGVNIEESR